MAKIITLDENTINKIAAGEVVERPASVVKELVENSIDAGATRISVEIKKGGISFIRISDNGKGIEEDDVQIAFERHSTSKIRHSDELSSILTLGFRGEALSSIAAVSKVEMVTKTQGSSYGTNIFVNGGNIEEIKQIGAPAGTTITVKELFYNTPARFKFLKKDSTEAGYVSDIISRIALGNPDISIKFINNGTTIIHTPGNNDLLSTIASIYGSSVARHLSEIKYQEGFIKLTGYAGSSEISRATRNQQSIFINGRYIKSKIITAAIDEAYKTILMKRKFPFIVLKMEINTAEVDINVHPAKMEVRFSNENEVFGSVYNAVSSSLMKGAKINEYTEKTNTHGAASDDYNIIKEKQQAIHLENYNEVDGNAKNKRNVYKENNVNINNSSNINDNSNINNGNKDIYDKNNLANIRNEIIREKTASDYKPEFLKKPVSDSGYTSLSNFNKDTNADADNNIISNTDAEIDTRLNTELDIRIDNDYSKNSSQSINNDIHIIDDSNSMNAGYVNNNIENKTNFTESTSDIDQIRGAKIVGQIFSTYILLQKNDYIFVVDQHAAHERILFEKLKVKFLNNEKIAQLLLAPVVIELTFQELQLAMENKKLFDKLGFIFEDFGNNSIILRSIPYKEQEGDEKELFLQLLDCITTYSGKIDNTLELEEEALYQIACKAAIKANMKLDDMEKYELIKELIKLANPYTCPHGRPTIIKISKNELEKMFKRKV